MDIKSTFPIGKRFELSPSTDQWMMGDRYGEVVKVNEKTGLVHMRMDRSGKVIRCLPEHLIIRDGNP
jgi:ribosomal protein L21E